MPGQHAITSFLAGTAIYNNQAASPALKYLFLHSSLPRLNSSWNSHTCKGKVHIRRIIKQNKVLLLSQSCYSVTPLTLFL